MKLQDVILKAMAKKKIAGVTDRTMRRIRQLYQEFGYTGLFDQRRGQRSVHPLRAMGIDASEYSASVPTPTPLLF